MILDYDTDAHTMTVRGGEASAMFMYFRDLNGAKSELFTDTKAGVAGLMFTAGDLLYMLEDDETQGGRLTITRA